MQWHGGMLLIGCSSWLSQPTSLYNSELPAQGTTYGELLPLTSIIDQENALQTCPTGRFCRGVFSVLLSLLRYIGLCEVD